MASQLLIASATIKAIASEIVKAGPDRVSVIGLRYRGIDEIIVVKIIYWIFSGGIRVRLGMLSRTIIVLSALWMIGGTMFIALQMSNRADKVADAVMRSCNEESTLEADCLTVRHDAYTTEIAELSGGLWGYAIVQALMLLGIVLTAFGIVYGAFRWITAGRQR